MQALLNSVILTKTGSYSAKKITVYYRCQYPLAKADDFNIELEVVNKIVLM